MTRIRALVVDDEPVARDRLIRLLEQQGDIDLVGQCSNGLETVTAIEQLSPDLVFLDVQMPGMTGVEVLAQVGPEAMPPTTRGKVTFAGPTGSPSARSMITKRNSTMIAPA